ncbi:uncharacterized protein LOC125369149 [Ricinus communis]|uniref:uncharacterized protein LOC125369149 n=1 Tax=Ricinus communis TaxID=3988 RepID=UPI00201AB03D|nr:uncharacterized protein LOC125369149 [Ricinus communis]
MMILAPDPPVQPRIIWRNPRTISAIDFQAESDRCKTSAIVKLELRGAQICLLIGHPSPELAEKSLKSMPPLHYLSRWNSLLQPPSTLLLPPKESLHSGELIATEITCRHYRERLEWRRKATAAFFAAHCRRRRLLELLLLMPSRSLASAAPPASFAAPQTDNSSVYHGRQPKPSQVQDTYMHHMTIFCNNLAAYSVVHFCKTLRNVVTVKAEI